MVFFADMAFALELIALGVGVFLLVRIGSEKEACCRGFAKLVSYFIIVGAVLSMACTLVNAYRAYKDKPTMMMKMGHPGMRPGGPMMGPGGHPRPQNQPPAEAK